MYDIQIPANIFQTWHTKQLPLLMFNAVNKLKQNNPRFKHFLFDDNDCREFIKNNFDGTILKAYDSLIPGAYKADLWRYCVLYIHGGIYLDIKYTSVNSFKFFNLLKKEHWALDFGGGGIYNALMVCKPGNEILLKAINQIVINVNNKFYGNGFLDPTGPGLLYKYFNQEDISKFDTKHIVIGTNDYDRIIIFNGIVILKCYPGYFKERENNSIVTHYSTLWKNRCIYA